MYENQHTKDRTSIETITIGGQNINQSILRWMRSEGQVLKEERLREVLDYGKHNLGFCNKCLLAKEIHLVT
jgi:hypothetical protein